MFGRDEREKDVQRQPFAGGSMPEERRVAAWIGSQISIKGDLTCSEDLTIAGHLEGNVNARGHTLTVAPGAMIQGDIVARTVSLHGQFKGRITAESKLEIGPTGSVEGAAIAARMVIAEGAALDGQVTVGGPVAPS